MHQSRIIIPDPPILLEPINSFPNLAPRANSILDPCLIDHVDQPLPRAFPACEVLDIDPLPAPDVDDCPHQPAIPSPDLLEPETLAPGPNLMNFEPSRIIFIVHACMLSRPCIPSQGNANQPLGGRGAGGIPWISGRRPRVGAQRSCWPRPGPHRRSWRR